MRTNDSLTGFTRYFALVVGGAFTLAGLAGFLPFFTPHAPPDAPHLLVDVSYGLLLGLFPVNLIHNLFHLGVGVMGLLAFRSYPSALQFSRFLGIALGILTLMGPVSQTDMTAPSFYASFFGVSHCSEESMDWVCSLPRRH
jgi:hypothetical protein